MTMYECFKKCVYTYMAYYYNSDKHYFYIFFPSGSLEQKIKLENSTGHVTQDMGYTVVKDRKLLICLSIFLFNLTKVFVLIPSFHLAIIWNG